MKCISKYSAAVLFGMIVWMVGGLGIFSIQTLQARSVEKTKSIGFFVTDSDAVMCLRAKARNKIPQVEIGVFTQHDLTNEGIMDFVKHMDVAVVDIMARQPAGWLLENISFTKPGVEIYAVRESNHAEDFRNAGFIFDPSIQSYFGLPTEQNVNNMIGALARRKFNLTVEVQSAVLPPGNALYHPEADGLFADISAYIDWYMQTGRYKPDGLWDLVVVFPAFVIESKKAPVDALVRAYEKNGINTVVWLRERRQWVENLERIIDTDPLRTRLGSITGLALKFDSVLSDRLLPVLERADVAIFNPQMLFFSDGDQWWASEQGIAPVEISMQFSVPELSGLVEPTVIGVKEKSLIEKKTQSYAYVPVKPWVWKLARRARNWHRLKQAANRRKKIALIYYNHGGGKHNIGASYLNVFKSLQQIAAAMQREGYDVRGELCEESIRELLIKTGRNVGAWAPGELDRMTRGASVVEIPVQQYKQWLSKTPREFQNKVEENWGKPENSIIMFRDGKFIIPCIRLGSLYLMPQPPRGWGDDPDKLYHSKTLYPHHQYVAFYLWLQHGLKPHAVINLGTHGTHEWLPGKQAGLSPICPPEVLLGDLVSLYPYIVDDVGEGIQAKRRGRGVIIDHGVPPIKSGGLYREYAELKDLMGAYRTSSSARIKTAKLDRIRNLGMQLGLDKELGIADFHEDSLQKLEHYLIALKTEKIPYGLHTFGLSAGGKGLDETASIVASETEQPIDAVKAKLAAGGPSEIESLMRALRGGYVPPSSGGDPVRNPESLPTGKNFYSFDPDKLPSKEAWQNGRKAAEQIVQAYRAKHSNAYPEQVAVVLWSVETIRNEGINVSTAMYLMGMQPIWDKKDRVVGIRPIPGSKLNRPRIDVLLQMSGLFRDTFPNVALWLDKAVQKAAGLTDSENYVRKHSAALRQNLLRTGVSLQEAEKLSLVRLFSAPPGSYGTKVSELARASGLWEDDHVVAQAGFVDKVSHGYSSDGWGRELQAVYRSHLRSVDVTVHSISSNVYGLMDNDDMFQYLGGLTMAVRKESGREPDVFISMQRKAGRGAIQPIASILGKELRSRHLNPKWISGMMKEGYAGAREISNFVEYLWGWSLTVPHGVNDAEWQQVYEVYVEDKYDLGIKDFFDKTNPWAYQAVLARTLESVRKGAWKADEKTIQKLAYEYALQVIEKGPACNDLICNHPRLNDMVSKLLVAKERMSPRAVAQFDSVLEKAAGSSMERRLIERKALHAKEKTKIDPTEADRLADMSQNARSERMEMVEGYQVQEVGSKPSENPQNRSMDFWMKWLSAFVLIGLFVWGLRHSG